MKHQPVSPARALLLCVLALPLPGCFDTDNDTIAAQVTGTWPKPEACEDHNPLRNVYYGDLHVHTSYSFDAHVFDTRNDPFDAYAFARGGELMLPPLGPDGNGTIPIRLSRPLDFASITDHGEYLGEVSTCLDTSSPGYNSETCTGYRVQDLGSFTRFGTSLYDLSPERFEDVCGSDGLHCKTAASIVWEKEVEAAESAQDRSSACQFTSLIGYEYTGVPGISNLHRNVIFRSSVVPAQPTTYFEEPTPQGLWKALQTQCRDGLKGCDVLAIPHNSNLGNGKMFNIEYLSENPDDIAILRSEAALRADLEPLVEIFQHKGESECINGYAGVLGDSDEGCAFEKVHLEGQEDCLDSFGASGMTYLGCVSRFGFMRGALGRGLKEEERLGINPFKFGVISSTDTHNATPGATEEWNFKGHGGNQEDETSERMIAPGLGVLSGSIRNPGGLAAVWAEENSREAIFDALRRRETFATSGTRLATRLFGGWDYPEAMCDDPDMIHDAYDNGVPMGSNLPARTTSGAPRFLVNAVRDAGVDGHDGLPLQRIQMIKGWYQGGELHEKVFEIAGDPDNGATVNLETCEPVGTGADSLCTVWTDPEFDAAHPAFYYARILENPSCRWNQWECLTLGAAERSETCDDLGVPQTIQERAWTSPIWYAP